jgi:hypothetical protein
MTIVRRLAASMAACCALACVLPSPALARVFVGVGVGPYWGPAYYPPPPVYYAPPPVVYAPPPVYSPIPRAPYQQTCYAGAYSCPMERPTATGATCYCAGNNGQRVWGRAN